MFKRHMPPEVAAPTSLYAHAVETPVNVRMLHVSGQLGVRTDGTTPADFEGQYRQVWANIAAILKSGGMDKSDIVKMSTFLVKPEHVVPARTLRDEIMQGLRVASTLVVIQALAAPHFLVEIEVTAAKA